MKTIKLFLLLAITLYKLTFISVAFAEGGDIAEPFVTHWNSDAPGINAEFSVFPYSGYTIIVQANLGYTASPVADQVRRWVAHVSA